jgi:hypothetical protein
MPKPIPMPAPLPAELERRIEALERIKGSGDFDRASWFWLLLLGVVTPAALLLWGWWT